MGGSTDQESQIKCGEIERGAAKHYGSLLHLWPTHIKDGARRPQIFEKFSAPAAQPTDRLAAWPAKRLPRRFYPDRTQAKISLTTLP